jgi:hypothetical protein
MAFSGASLLAGRNAHQVVGQARQVVGRERVLVQGVEVQVVLGLHVAPLHLQFGHQQGLDERQRGRRAAQRPALRQRSCRKAHRPGRALRPPRQAVVKKRWLSSRRRVCCRRAARGRQFVAAARPCRRCATARRSQRRPVCAAQGGLQAGGWHPACEWLNAARRMSDSFCTSGATSAWKRRAFARCAACQVCEQPGRHLGVQPSTSPSAGSALPARDSTCSSTACSPVRHAPTRPAAAPVLGQRAGARRGRRRSGSRVRVAAPGGAALAFDATRRHAAQQAVHQAGQRLHRFGPVRLAPARPGSRAAPRSGHGTAPAARGAVSGRRWPTGLQRSGRVR